MDLNQNSLNVEKIPLRPTTVFIFV